MSSGKKKGLGRGLSALFGDEKPQDKPQETNKSNTVSISDLSRNPNQPRQHFSEQKLEELANSIKKNGIIQPKNCQKMAQKCQNFLTRPGQKGK